MGIFPEEHVGDNFISCLDAHPKAVNISPTLLNVIYGKAKTWLSGSEQTKSPNTIRRANAGSNGDAPGWATGTSSPGYVFETIDIPVDIDSLFIMLQADEVGGIDDYFSIDLDGNNILNFDLETIVPGEVYGYEYVVPEELKGQSLVLGRLLTNHSANYSEVWSSDFFYTSSATLVTIDVKPGSDPNCFNINGHGVIPVAILGAEDFNVSQIEPSSLSFGELAVRVRGKKGPLCSIDDPNNDTYPDLVCHFEDDDSSAWETGVGEATLTGNLFDGTAIEGSDSICVVP